MLTCEKLLHGHRQGRLIEVKGEDGKPTGEKKRVGQSVNHPYRCDKPAVKYAVSGDSFTAFTTLCKMHKEVAEKSEGFKFKEVSE